MTIYFHRRLQLLSMSSQVDLFCVSLTSPGKKRSLSRMLDPLDLMMRLNLARSSHFHADVTEREIHDAL